MYCEIEAEKKVYSKCKYKSANNGRPCLYEDGLMGNL